MGTFCAQIVLLWPPRGQPELFHSSTSFYSPLVAQMVKNPPATQEMWVRSLGWEDSPGGEHGCPLQYSCLENSGNRGTWRTSVHRVTKNWSQLKRLSKLSKNLPLPPLLLLISKLERSHPMQTWCTGTVLQVCGTQ